MMDEQNKEDAVGRNLEPETEARIWKPDQGSLILLAQELDAMPTRKLAGLLL